MTSALHSYAAAEAPSSVEPRATTAPATAHATIDVSIELMSSNSDWTVTVAGDFRGEGTVSHMLLPIPVGLLNANTALTVDPSNKLPIGIMTVSEPKTAERQYFVVDGTGTEQHFAVTLKTQVSNSSKDVCRDTDGPNGRTLDIFFPLGQLPAAYAADPKTLVLASYDAVRVDVTNGSVSAIAPSVPGTLQGMPHETTQRFISDVGGGQLELAGVHANIVTPLFLTALCAVVAMAYALTSPRVRQLLRSRSAPVVRAGSLFGVIGGLGGAVWTYAATPGAMGQVLSSFLCSVAAGAFGVLIKSMTAHEFPRSRTTEIVERKTKVDL